jgi:hypothetical protein
MSTTTINKIKPRKVHPSLKTLYNRYDEITEDHCKKLLHHLYTHNITEWINPITKRDVDRDGPIVLSFLSKCYYVWGEKIVTIYGLNIKYKEHVEKFIIHPAYLYDVRNRPSPTSGATPGATSGATPRQGATSGATPRQGATPGATPRQGATSGATPRQGATPGATPRRSNSPAGAPSPRRKSPPKIAINVPVLHVQTPQLPQSPPGAATNKPKSSSSSAKIDYSPKGSYAAANKSATLSINADKLNEDECINLVREIRNIKRGKTVKEINKDNKLKVINPITKMGIGLKSPILQSYLTKCYFAFDKNEELRKSIKKIVNIKGLEIYNDIRLTIATKHEEERLAREKKEEEERLAREKKEEEKRLALEETKKRMKEKIPIIDDYIKGLVDEFYKCCEELNANCDKDGILKEYKYISNVINSIIIIIYTKYLHLPYYYDELYLNNTSQQDLKIFMYDDTLSKYYKSKSLIPWEVFKKKFCNKDIIYQKNDLTKMVGHTNIQLNPNSIENYHLNTLLNRQHVFEAFKYDHYHGNDYINEIIQYNKINTSYDSRLYFGHYMFPDSLKYAKEIIDELDINYNITNGLLPKTIFCASIDRTLARIIAANRPFSELTDIINDKLDELPTINGIAKEATINDDHYDTIIENMKVLSFGNNETEYGSTDMIRKNILYSLNAQYPTYIERNMVQHKKNIYYNYEYTGTFPLFSWIPLNHENIGSDTNLKYCFPMSTKWQPFSIDAKQGVLRELELSYKNHGIEPFSTYLNETIYKVLTDEYASVKSLVIAQRIRDMTSRITKTVGAYKDETIKPNYNNKKIYLYHGTKKRLHSIGGKGKEIEILGFLSTSLNIYTASYYSGVGQNNVGLIYIIEVDDKHSYINLKDELNQFLILPQSRIKIIMEFNVGGICVILCRLFRTPSVEQNNLLYDKLLDQKKATAINKYVTYRITANNNIMPTCAYILGDLWKTVKDVHYKENLEIYKVIRGNLNNKIIYDKNTMTHMERKDEFLYFSLGQEYELYVDRGVPLISGSLEDIKYSIHQHFIKDCYKALDIPCIDYIFIHGANKAKNKITGTQFNKCPISTGILLKDYKNNRTDQYKYNINNFLIDSIFMFNSIKHENKKLNLQEEQGDGKIYADKIEGFRDAGAYLNGSINPLFKKDEEVGQHIQYMRDWNHLFIKYKEASNEDLAKHFDWCYKRITKLMEIITSVSENYLFFISKTLKGNTKTSQSQGREGVLSPDSKEYIELFNLIKNLEETLLKRAKFFLKCTRDGGRGRGNFIDFIKFLLSDNTQQNTHNSKLYKHAIQEELVLQDTGLFTGGIMSIKDMSKQGARIKSDTETTIDHMKIYEDFKNIPISESKDMRKFKDMPKDMQAYYGGGKDEKGKYINAGKYIDISNNCHFRFVNKKDSSSSS